MPEQFGLQILVNAGSPSAYWRFEDDLRDDVEDARADLADALECGYAAEHLRVVTISVFPPDRSES